MATGRFQSFAPVLPVETALRDPQPWNCYANTRNHERTCMEPDGRVVCWVAAAAGGAVFGGGLHIAENLHDGRAPGDYRVWLSLEQDEHGGAMEGTPLVPGSSYRVRQ